MDKKQYEWLLAVALAWRTLSVGDDDPSPLIAQIDGISGRLVHVAWVAANEAGFGAVCLGIWHSGSAKFVAMFVVAVNFSAKVAFAQDSAEILHFSYERADRFGWLRLVSEVPTLMLSHNCLKKYRTHANRFALG